MSNTLAYFGKAEITTTKNFIELFLRQNVACFSKDKQTVA
jgi:hypothetical protein